jgi:hypothetical protein
MAGAAVVVVPRAQAVSLSMGAPVPVAGGWMRAAGHYDSGASQPTFQVVARCGPGSSDVHVLYSIHVTPAEGTLWLDVPGTPDRLGPSDVACETPELSLEMIVDATVVASAALPRREGGSTRLPAAVLDPAALPLPAPQRRVRLNGQKYASPVGARSEAGVALSLGSHVSIQLNYARTAQVPMMGYANDNGVLARLRFGF